MKNNPHAHMSATCFLGSASILVDRLLRESIMVQWASVPMALGVVFLVLAIKRGKRQ